MRVCIEEKFPRIASLAVKIGARLFFTDESGCRANEQGGRTWGLIGQRPVVQSSPEGELRFKVVDHSIRSQDVIDFLQALIKESDRPVIILADVCIVFTFQRR